MKTVQVIAGIVTDIWDGEVTWESDILPPIDDSSIVKKGDIYYPDTKTFYTLKSYEKYIGGDIVVDIDKLKKSKYPEIEKLQSKYTNANTEFNGHTFEANEKSRAEIAKTTEFANSVVNGSSTAPWTAKDTWKDSEGVRIKFNTPQEFIAFSEQIYLRTENNLVNADNHEDNINALTTVEEIENYDITTGWK